MLLENPAIMPLFIARQNVYIVIIKWKYYLSTSGYSARHVGDFGNHYRNDKGYFGTIKTRHVDYLAKLYGEESIIGRGMVVNTISVIFMLFSCCKAIVAI